MRFHYSLALLAFAVVCHQHVRAEETQAATGDVKVTHTLRTFYEPSRVRQIADGKHVGDVAGLSVNGKPVTQSVEYDAAAGRYFGDNVNTNVLQYRGETLIWIVSMPDSGITYYISIEGETVLIRKRGGDQVLTPGHWKTDRGQSLRLWVEKEFLPQTRLDREARRSRRLPTAPEDDSIRLRQEDPTNITESEYRGFVDAAKKKPTLWTKSVTARKDERLLEQETMKWELPSDGTDSTPVPQMDEGPELNMNTCSISLPNR